MLLKTFSILICVWAFSLSCTKKNQKEIPLSNTSGYSVDPQLISFVNSLLYKQEYFDYTFEVIDSIIREPRSSNVELISLSYDEILDIEEKEAAYAYFEKDTLNINIYAPHFAFAHNTIIIKCTGNRFRSYIRHTDDMASYGETNFSFQKLQLNKNKFTVGDSVYGYIYARTKISKEYTHYAKGYFRTIIKKTNH